MGDSRKPQDTADTVPAEPASPSADTAMAASSDVAGKSGKPGSSDGDRPETERAHRATMPDIAPPFEQRYRLGVELGRGGMGRVVEAFDTQLGRTVALKEVLPRGSSGVDQRFEREVQITARLEHPSIVPLYDAGTMPDGRAFYVMRRVTGRPLDELITRARDLEERLVLLPNVLAALDAIAHAHKRGIIHRDLKPANILVGENGETIVIDWGLAKVIGEEEADAGAGMAIEPQANDSLHTVAGAVFGTPGFMAPEQARGEEQGPRGDVFALGATLYQLLVGRPPIGGRSATDAIASSIQRKIVPVAIAAPSAPVELVAVVEKALMYAPEDRYQNAGGLAEDVRRFLTGQVVAAHRYTRRQMIARFAKRHRAPLSVAALAMVVVALLAWVGVHRILVERDSANSARADAETERSTVLRVNAQLIEHTDQLLITRARALVETNPTESLALLKELRASSQRMGDAHAIAQAAVHRGVPWAFRADGEPRVVSLDLGVHHLAELTADGTLHVWDLDNHRVLYERMYQPHADPVWVTGGKLLLISRVGCDELDLRSGTLTRVAQLPLAYRGLESRDGAHVVLASTTGELGMYDVAAHTWTPLWPDHSVENFEIAPDASWIAATDKLGMVVLSSTGKVLFERTGKLLLESTTAHSIALFDLIGKKEARVIELELEPTPVWHEAPLPLPDKNFPLAAYYRANILEVVTATAILHYHEHRLAFSTPMSEFNAFAIHDMAAGIEIVTSRDGSLRFSDGGVSGKIDLPVPVTNPHLAGQPGSSRFVVAGNGIVLLYDLADIVPKTFEKHGEMNANFLDATTLLLWPDDLVTLTTRDLVTGETHAFEHEFLPGTFTLSSDASTGRMLLAEPIGTDRLALDLVQKGHYDLVKRFGTGHVLTGRLAKPGLLAATDRDPRVLYAQTEQKFVELAKVDGGVQSMITMDRDKFAALGRSGELVRGTLGGGPLERVHVEIDANSFLGLDHMNHALLVTGKHVSVWEATLRPLVELPRAATAVEPVSGGLLLVLDSHAAYLLDESNKLHELVSTTDTDPTVGGDGTWIASAGNGGRLTIVELPSLARWTLPQLYGTTLGMLVGAPAKRFLIQGMASQIAIWNLAEVTGDFAGWLDTRTNAFENTDGFVTWPWLRP